MGNGARRVDNGSAPASLYAEGMKVRVASAFAGGRFFCKAGSSAVTVPASGNLVPVADSWEGSLPSGAEEGSLTEAEEVPCVPASTPCPTAAPEAKSTGGCGG